MDTFKNKMPVDYYGSHVINEFTNFSFNQTDYTAPMYFRNPKREFKLSLNHIEVIEFFIRLLRPKNFIEMGTQFGETAVRVLPLIPEHYYGVDIIKQDNMKFLDKKYDNMCFFEMSTDEFFENAFDKRMFDMAFIDASHDYEQTLKDFINIKDFIVPDGIIFFHDTYPSTIEETKPNLSGDCYRLPEKIRLEHNDEFEIITFPVNPGLSMARKIKKHIGDEK